MVLKLGDNKAIDDEIINLHRGLYCFKVTPKGASKSMPPGQFRTLKVEFGSHLEQEQLPSIVTFFLTSEANSYGVESSTFIDGDPCVIDIVLNNQEVYTLKPVKMQYLKEIREGCSERTIWEMAVDGFLQKSKEMCPVFCTPFLLPGIEFLPCQTDYDYLCSAQVFSEEFKRIRESYSTSCSKLSYAGKVLSFQRIEGLPKLVHLDYPDQIYPVVLIPFDDMKKNQPTVMLSYEFDMPVRTRVYQETLLVSIIDLIGIVGGTLSLYTGLAFYDAFFQIIEYCNIIISKIDKIFKSRKIGAKNQQPNPNSTPRKEKPEDIAVEKGEDAPQSLKKDDGNDSKKGTRKTTLDACLDIEEGKESSAKIEIENGDSSRDHSNSATVVEGPETAENEGNTEKNEPENTEFKEIDQIISIDEVKKDELNQSPEANNPKLKFKTIATRVGKMAMTVRMFKEMQKNVNKISK